MSKSLIYTALQTTVTPAIGNTVPVGSIIRRKGCGIRADSNVINLTDPGYYDVEVQATVAASAAGNVVLQLMANGVAVPGAIATVNIATADTQIETIGITGVVRVNCCNDVTLSVSVGGTAIPTISNMAVKVVHE